MVFDDAVIRKLVAVNPCKSITKTLGKKRQHKTHFAALPYAEAPALIVRLNTLPGNAARALQFAMLTAARTGEIIGMTWDELSKDGATWTVPASRMKAGEEHTVALSPLAREVLDRMPRRKTQLVFPSPEHDAPMSSMGMLMLLRRLEVEKKTTVHGLCRSTFSTWANDLNIARSDVIEACLAHRESDRVKAAYSRAQFQADRRALLEAWAVFLSA